MRYVNFLVFRYVEYQGPAAGCIKQRMVSGNGVTMSWMKKARRVKLLLLLWGWDEDAFPLPADVIVHAWSFNSCTMPKMSFLCLHVCPLSLHWVSSMFMFYLMAKEQQVKPVSATRRQVRFSYPLELPASRVVHLYPQYRWCSPNTEGLSTLGKGGLDWDCKGKKFLNWKSLHVRIIKNKYI